MSPPERRPRRAAAGRPPGDDPHDAALGRVLARLPQTESELQDGRLLGPLQLAELLALPLGERVERIGREPRFRHAGLVEAASDRAELLLAEQPRKALAAAELAASAAAAAGCRGGARLSDLCARALGQAAEALCRLGQPALAGPILHQAEASLAAGSGDPLEEAALHLRAARRARELGELAELLERLDAAEDLYRQVGRPAGVSRARLAQARVMGFGPPANWAQAVRLARRALEGFDAREDPALAARARLQLAWNLADAGQPEEARGLLLGRRRAPAPAGGRAGQLALLWVQARVALRLGRPADAGPAFQAVAAGWRSLGRHRTAALAVVDGAEAQAAAGESSPAACTVFALARSLEDRKRLHCEGLKVLRGLGDRLDGWSLRQDGRPMGREDFAALACYLQLHWHRPLAPGRLAN